MSSGRPIYFRLLGLRHLRLTPTTTLILFEGSIVLGLLLLLADLVNWWGVVAVPVAVAAMVKLHDVVEGALNPAQNDALRPSERGAVGRSAVLPTSYPTAAFQPDDAVADPAATPDGDPDDRGGRPGEGSAEAGPEGGATPRPAPGPQVPPPPVPPSLPKARLESPPVPADADAERLDAADWRGRGNQGRFTS